jgi:uncharacterized protein
MAGCDVRGMRTHAGRVMNRLQVEQVEVPLVRLPEGLDGLRVLHLSDLHVGRLGRGRLAEAERRVGSLRPELVVFTGDTVNHGRYWGEAARWLRELPVPPEVPRLAVPGNWDYRAGGARRFAAAMGDGGFVPLRNRGLRVSCRGGEVQVAGFDDLRRGRFRPREAWARLDPARFTLGLAHTPDILLHVDGADVDLWLAGHTHGGQIRFPGRDALFTSTQVGSHYADGLRPLVPRGWLYVSRGLGEGNVPFRLGCPPALALLTLRRILKQQSTAEPGMPPP